MIGKGNGFDGIKKDGGCSCRAQRNKRIAAIGNCHESHV